MMLMPHALTDIESVAWFSIDALTVQDAVTRATENNNNRFVVFVRHRVGMRRIDVTVDFDNSVVEAELLRAKAAKPNAVGCSHSILTSSAFSALRPALRFAVSALRRSMRALKSEHSPCSHSSLFSVSAI